MKKSISKETILRTAILFITLINQILTMIGKNPLPFSDAQIYEIFSAAAAITATVWAWWKNNSFTQPAIKADELIKELKSNGKTN